MISFRPFLRYSCQYLNHRVDAFLVKGVFKILLFLFQGFGFSWEPGNNVFDAFPLRANGFILGKVSAKEYRHSLHEVCATRNHQRFTSTLCAWCKKLISTECCSVGLVTYNILQNPKYKEAFGITDTFALAHSRVRSLKFFGVIRTPSSLFVPSLF